MKPAYRWGKVKQEILYVVVNKKKLKRSAENIAIYFLLIFFNTKSCLKLPLYIYMCTNITENLGWSTKGFKDNEMSCGIDIPPLQKITNQYVHGLVTVTCVSEIFVRRVKFCAYINKPFIE